MNENQIAQAAVLGCILKENHLIEDPNHREEFFTGSLRVLYRAMKQLNNENKPLDMVSLLTMQMKTDFGGVATLTECQNRSYVKKYDSYLKLVREQFQEREKVAILSTALSDGWSLETITNKLNELTTSDVSDRVEIKQILAEMLEEPWTPKPESEGTLKTGLTRLDQMTGGLSDTDLVVVAARPSMGKTDFMNHLIIKAGTQDYIPVFFSLEMNAKKIVRRLVGTVGVINRMQLKDPHKYLNDKKKEQWTQILAETGKTNLVVYEKPAQTLNEIKAKVREERLKNPNKKILVGIDYLTLMRHDDFKPGMEVKMYTTIVEGLKSIAKEFNVVMVVLSQLSRKCEERNDKRPMSSDIRESGGIEQAADVIIGLYRESYYNICNDTINDSTLELIILKNREGAVGTVYTNYNKMTGIVTDGVEPPYAKTGR